MFRKFAAHLVTLITLVLLAHAVAAAPKDKAAQKRIDQAINEHYLATDFDKAEGLLLGVIQACEDKCSPGVVAKAWMYIGIVRGSARGDIPAAQEAFQTAIQTDGSVQLDEGLTTPEVKDAWVAAGGVAGAGGSSVDVGAGAAVGEEEDEDVVGNMECTPIVSELETRRPLPVSCMTDEPAAKMELLYKEFGSSEWGTVVMGRKGDTWIGQIPCSATDLVGTLQWYVRAKNASGETVDNYGSLKTPVSTEIVNSTSEPPPSYPGADPPARCADAGECPEEMLGTPSCPGTSKDGPRGSKAWGDPCEASKECEIGLYCISGTCESAPTCDKNSDCASNKCVDFTCDMTGVDGGGGSSGDAPKNTIAVTFAYDLLFGSPTSTACAPRDEMGAPISGDYVCSQGGAAYTDFVVLNDAAVSGGLLRGTTRLMLSYERLLWKQLSAELRGGVAFGGAPWGDLFLPVHLEGRGKWWFGDLASAGVRAYVGIQFGLGQFDGTIVASIDDVHASSPTPPVDVCETTPPSDPLPAGVRCGVDGNTVSAHRQLGQMFAGINAGVKGAITRNFGVVVNVNLNMPFPSFGIVIEPSAALDVSF